MQNCIIENWYFKCLIKRIKKKCREIKSEFRELSDRNKYAAAVNTHSRTHITRGFPCNR